MKLSDDGLNLVAENGETLELPWRGYKVYPASEGYLVLLKGDKDRNIVFMDKGGKLKWHAVQKVDIDRYWGASVIDGKLYGYTGYGFKVELDPETGKILSEVFTK